jgi:hypothetical protein
MGDPIDLFESTLQDALIFVWAPRRAKGNLQLTFQDGKGGLKFVGGVGTKLTDLAKGGV